MMEPMNMVELERYFKQKACNKGLPYSVQFDITNRCNAKCIFCLYGCNQRKISEEDFSKELSYNEILDVLKQLKDLGTFYIGIAGGEPLVRKDCIEIIKKAKEMGFVVTLVTNGHCFTTRNIKELIESKIDSVTVSFHSINRKKYDYLFGINSNKFDKVIKGIKLLLKSNVNLGIAVTETKYNIGEFIELFEYMKNLGVNKDRISLNGLLPGAVDIKNILPTNVQIRNIYEHNYDLLQRNNNYKKDKDDFYVCSAGRSAFCIDPYGNIKPCVMIQEIAGNIRTDSIRDIWNNSIIFEELRALKAELFTHCNICEFKNMCLICMGRNKVETGDYYKPSEEYCNIVKAKWSNIQYEK